MSPPDIDAPSYAIMSQLIRSEREVVGVRQRARLIAQLLGFGKQDQTRLATAVSEIARNALKYAGGGKVEYRVVLGRQALLEVRVSDQGPGIRSLDLVLGGTYVSETGLGVGMIGSKRLMDLFDVETGPGGTSVRLGKLLGPQAKAPTPAEIGQLGGRLALQSVDDPLDVAIEQNRELLQTLEALRVQQEELGQVNSELQDTNRGVLALYAELDEKAISVQRASDFKSRFLSNVSHEFRTPVNSVLSLTRLLLDRRHGPLTPEQELQVTHIRRAMESLADIVEDLLDLAKVEAGKTTLRLKEFTADELFGALRGMFKPLLAEGGAVELVVEDLGDVPVLRTDEGKVQQILRNLISNALKFTERGQVRVAGEYDEAHDTVTFAVSDTGVGIPAADLERVFEEFAQLEGTLQAKVKGTGLGLPLSRKLAGMLGGHVEVRSALGLGSTFTLEIPRDIDAPRVRTATEPDANAATATVPSAAAEARAAGDGRHRRALIIDDSEMARYLLKDILAQRGYEVVEAASGAAGLDQAASCQPDVIFLDLAMPGGADGFAVLRRLKDEPATRAVPVVINSSQELSAAERATLARDSVAIVVKGSTSLAEASAKILSALRAAGDPA